MSYLRTNDELFDDAMESISELFNDSRVSTDGCIANLNALKEEIETLLESLGE